ncbi:tetratricopeptide repeat protein [Propioniciclava sp. MC1595]|uniref:tetratricopeptide repeat protein n=1 Tax=Propioniciclava sp. MC1595 TaxID=2760308 RepID=UPI00166230BD|nr:tetratricopeptide repeat protein [Propioniciclava sp. MC1595]MBB1494087.1 tetratricopeptide repeat protein [Propioniciclava sp. MC1595]
MLLFVAALVPDESVAARSAAQVVAVLVPLGVEVVRDRWQATRHRDRRMQALRARLEPLSASPPAELKVALDDPAYRIAPYWGRAGVHRQLDAARSLPGPVVVLATGPAWTGKTRLLTEWALGLPQGVVTGWLRHGTVDAVMTEAATLDAPVVLLFSGRDEDAATVLATVAGGAASAMIVVESRDPSHLAEVARSISPAAGRLAETATVVTVSNPGGPSDSEFRYGQMVLAYGKVLRNSSLARAPHTTFAWGDAPIGLMSAFAMLHASSGRSTPLGSPMKAFAGYWDTLCASWLKPGPDTRFGLPDLSEVQLRIALAVCLLSGNDHTEAVLAGMPLYSDQLRRHQVEELTKWAHATSGASPTRSTLLAAVAATQEWTTAQRQEVGWSALEVPAALAGMIRAVVAAEQILGERPLLARSLLAATFGSLQAALRALDGETVTRPIDLLLAEQVTAAALSGEETDSLLGERSLVRLPNCRVALLRHEFTELSSEAPVERRAELAFNLAIRLWEVGKPKEALEPVTEAVTLYRELADPQTGNPDRYTPDLATSLNNLANRLSEVGKPKEALEPATEAVTLRRRLADPQTGNPDRYTPHLAGSLNNLANRLSEVGKPKEALEPATEAVTLYRELADPQTGNPDRYTPHLAGSLNNLAALLSEVGKPKEALEPATEAVTLYRRLADPQTGNPDRYTPHLAGSLNNLAARLSEVGKSKEALEPATEAVTLYRRLADPQTGDPERFGSPLARAERVVLDLNITHTDEDPDQ